MVLKTILPCLCLLALPSLSSAWDDWSDYVPFPPEASGILNKTVHDLAASAPKVVTLGVMPERELFQKLQQVAIRNSNQNNLFKLDVNYVMGDGLDHECRIADGDPSESEDRWTDHHFNNKKKGMCKSHCTHHGRYCPYYSKDELAEKVPHDGSVLVMEMLRRLCLGYNVARGFSNEIFFEYMQQFDTNKCMDAEDLTACSKDILEKLDVSTGDDSPFAKCVAEADADTDTTNAILEHQLDVSHSLKYDMDQLPVLEIGDELFQGMNRADHILHEWCKHFTGDVKPVGCDFCNRCRYAKRCLWFLKCDGEPFDVETYNKPPEEANNKQKENGEETEVEHIEEVVVQDTKKILVFGFVLGLGSMAALWALAELKRKRAIAEVAKEMPVDGFRDDTGEDGMEMTSDGFKDEFDDDDEVGVPESHKIRVI